jgi:outer membrane lipoprotein-sorting protein
MAPALAEIVSRMADARKRLKTLSAKLEYTKVTVVVNDQSTELGQFFFRKAGKNPEILLKFEKPDPKTVLFTKNRAEIYMPKINQIQEYDLEEHGEMVQEYLLLGFGTETGELMKSYRVKLLGEEDLEGDTTSVLELVPQRESIAAHISKVHLWISEESWLPVQQKFFEPDGDYLVARYEGVRVNRKIPYSMFQISTARGAKRARMN